LGSAIFDALKNYGAYIIDQAGASVLYVEPTANEPAVDAARGDIGQIMQLLRLVTNNGPSSVGGPGTRLAPLAPAFG